MVKEELSPHSVFFILCFVAVASCLEETATKCSTGQYLDKRSGTCEPCPTGQYMPRHNHDDTSCIECKLLLNKTVFHSEVFQQCSPSSPTMFGCKNGYFRKSKDLTVEEQCLPCKNYTKYKTNCSFLQNAVCQREEL
jgi:hypothetical protein